MRADKLIDSGGKRGVTLVEILLVVTLSALFMVAIIPFIRSVNDTYNVGASKTEILQNGRGALEMLSRYIRQAPRITEIPGSSGNYIRLRTPGDTSSIVFYHNLPASKYYTAPTGIIKEGDLVMRDESTGTDTLFTQSIENFVLSFYKDNGTAATKGNQVRSVKIHMELKDSAQICGNLNLESIVYARQDTRIGTSLWAIDGAVRNNTLRELSSDITVTNFNIGTSSGDCLAADTSTGTCWIADTNNNRIIKVGPDGTVMFTSSTSGYKFPLAVSVNSSTGECWVANTNNNNIRKLQPNGTIIFTTSSSGYKIPSSVSVNSSTGECWVANTNNNNIRKLKPDGTIIFTTVTAGYSRPRSVSVNSLTGECWVANTNNNNIRKLQPNGTIIFTTPNIFNQPRSISVNSTTGECWVADTGNNRVVKLSSSGSVLWSSAAGVFSTPYSVSVNPTNGACWVADFGNNRVVRLNADGDEEFSISVANGPVAVSTNSD